MHVCASPQPWGATIEAVRVDYITSCTKRGIVDSIIGLKAIGHEIDGTNQSYSPVCASPAQASGDEQTATASHGCGSSGCVMARLVDQH